MNSYSPNSGRPPRRRSRLAAAGLLLAVLAMLGAGSLLAGAHDPPASLLPAETGPFWADEREDLLLDFVFKTQDVGNLAMTVSNHGFLGDNFSERTPSMEYPKGSEVDHLIRAGIWVGGINYNLETFVTTGVQDGYWGAHTFPTEFVPRSIPPEDQIYGWIRERSTLPTSPYYSPQEAISEQDFVTEFLDTLDRAHTPETGNADDWHNASGLLIRQESYAWSYEPADAMILFEWTIVPTEVVEDAYIGIYAELTTGYKGNTPADEWPPSGWFYHHELYWVDDPDLYGGTVEEPFNMVAENNPYDPDAPQYAGVKLLGAKYKHADGEWSDEIEQVSWRWWEWEPGSLARDNDTEKYAIMTQPGFDEWEDIESAPLNSNQGDSPVQLISTGPWDLSPGGPGQDPDTLIISYAFLAGDDFDDLIDNALYAQTVYRFNFTVPTPPFSPRMKVTTEQGRIRLLWEGSPERSVDPVTSDYDFEGYRIYIGRDPEEATFSLVKQYDLDVVPAKNPLFGAYFTPAWLESELDAHPEYGDEQGVLDAYWPGTYTYHAEEEIPYHVTEMDSVGYNTGLDAARLPESEWVTETVGDEEIVYQYEYVLQPVSDGHHYWVAITSYDIGTPETPSLESGISQNTRIVIPGRNTAQTAGRGVTVFPNPYRGSAIWDTNRATGRYVWFAGLPPRADIKIFTLAGDLVNEIDFDRDTYSGANAAGIITGDEGALAPTLSGTMAAWDLRNHNGQPVATGLYIFSVTDRDSGESQQGKFLVLK